MERRLRDALPKGGFARVAAKRSRLMSRIRGKHNVSTEVTLRMALVRARMTNWQMHQRVSDVRVDFQFPSERLVVFVDGCFWHGCAKCFKGPRTRTGYWIAKIDSNRNRDRRNSVALRRDGWRVLRVWEHELDRLERVVARIRWELLDR